MMASKLIFIITPLYDTKGIITIKIVGESNDRIQECKTLIAERGENSVRAAVKTSIRPIKYKATKVR